MFFRKWKVRKEEKPPLQQPQQPQRTSTLGPAVLQPQKVKVPKGAKPGAVISFPTPGGGSVEIEVPKGTKPGQVIQIMIPGVSTTRTNDDTLRQAVHARKSSAASMEETGELQGGKERSFARLAGRSPRSADSFVDRKARGGSYFSGGGGLFDDNHKDSDASGSGVPTDADYEMAKKVKDLGAVVTTLKASLEHRNARLVVVGLKLIKKATGGENAKRQRAVADAGGASVIVAAMRAFSENEDVQSEGCGAVIGGCDGHAHCQSAFGRAGAAAAVVAALEAFPESDVVASRGCGAVLDLAAGQPKNQERLGRLGACAAVLDAMKKWPNDADVQWRGCGALCYLADNHASNQKELIDCGAANVLCDAMRRFSDDEELHGRAAGAVCNLTAFQKQAQNDFGERGAVSLVVRALNMYGPNSPVVAHRCLGAVLYLCHGSNRNVERAHSAGAAAAVCQALKAHADDEDVQNRGLGCVWRLLPGADTHDEDPDRDYDGSIFARQDAFAAQGACEVILAALSRFQASHVAAADATMQERGFQALASLCNLHPENCARVARIANFASHASAPPHVSSPIELVLNAMDALPQERRVQVAALRCLANLDVATLLQNQTAPNNSPSQASDTFRKRVVRAAEERFPGDTELLRFGRKVLKNMANQRGIESGGSRGGGGIVSTALNSSFASPFGAGASSTLGNVSGSGSEQVPALSKRQPPRRKISSTSRTAQEAAAISPPSSSSTSMDPLRSLFGASQAAGSMASTWHGDGSWSTSPSSSFEDGDIKRSSIQL